MRTIFRKKLKSGFTIIPNAALKDERLSFKARGILALVLTKPDDWHINLVWLGKQASEGREAIRNSIQELCEAGYCRKVIFQDARGRMSNTIWQFTDSPSDGFPSVGKPSVGKPSSTNTVVTKTVVTKEPLGSFQTVRDYPSSEEQMMEAIHEVIGYNLESRAETIAVKFFIEMEAKKWKIKGQPIRDWMKVLFKRIEKTTGEIIDCEDYSHVPF
jgi:hypothetical protein